MSSTVSIEVTATTPFSLGDPFPAPNVRAYRWGSIQLIGDPGRFELSGLNLGPAVAAAAAGAPDFGPTDLNGNPVALSASSYRPAGLFTLGVEAHPGVVEVTLKSTLDLSSFLDAAEAKARELGDYEGRVTADLWALVPIPGYEPPYQWFWTNKIHAQEVQGTAPVGPDIPGPVKPDPVDPGPGIDADLTTIVTIGSQDGYIGFYFSEGSEWDFGHIAEPTFTVDGTRLHFAGLEFDAGSLYAFISLADSPETAIGWAGDIYLDGVRYAADVERHSSPTYATLATGQPWPPYPHSVGDKVAVSVAITKLYLP